MTNKLELSGSKFSLTEVKKAYLALLTTLLIIAFTPILVRICESSINPNTIVFNRVWIATTVLGLWNGLLLLKRRSLPNSSPIQLFPNIHNLLLLLILAIFFVVYQLFWAWSLTQTSLANSELFHSISPLFTTLLGWSLLGQKFDRIFLIGIAIAITGSIALAANDFSITLDKLEGDAQALLSAVFFAGYILIVEKLQTQLSITAIMTWNCLLGTFVFLPIFLVTHDQLFAHSWQGWLILIVYGMTTLFIQALIAYSLKSLSSGLVAAILLLNPILTAILAGAIFSETLNLFNWLALLIVLLGVYLATLSDNAIKV